jgi:hypothetical protein
MIFFFILFVKVFWTPYVSIFLRHVAKNIFFYFVSFQMLQNVMGIKPETPILITLCLILETNASILIPTFRVICIPAERFLKSPRLSVRLHARV